MAWWQWLVVIFLVAPLAIAGVYVVFRLALAVLALVAYIVMEIALALNRLCERLEKFLGVKWPVFPNLPGGGLE
jgi:hypothetical protein